MSLTTLLKKPEIRKAFKELTTKPKTPAVNTGVNGEIKAKSITKNYALIGTSFDYLMRFYLEQHNSTCITKTWVAKRAVDTFAIRMNDMDVNTYQTIMTEMFIEGAVGLSDNGDRYSIEGDSELYTAINNYIFGVTAYNRYIKTGILSDEIFIASILLGRLDPIFRGGFIDPNLGIVFKNDIQDLKNLICVLPNEEFIFKDKCLLNPTFGSGSQIVKGADADLIIDNTLIDIKTTKSRMVTRDMFNQIVGYYVLSKFDNLYDIEKVSLYFSRYGVKYTYNVKEIISEEDITTLKNIFIEQTIENRKRNVWGYERSESDRLTWMNYKGDKRDG